MSCHYRFGSLSITANTNFAHFYLTTFITNDSPFRFALPKYLLEISQYLLNNAFIMFRRLSSSLPKDPEFPADLEKLG